RACRTEQSVRPSPALKRKCATAPHPGFRNSNSGQPAELASSCMRRIIVFQKKNHLNLPQFHADPKRHSIAQRPTLLKADIVPSTSNPS
uniref:Uncharacterized protein n=1 Tax=Anopheles quadriannulatus TaxID=34691 RepID=A0A182XTA8_ANOQN